MKIDTTCVIQPPVIPGQQQTLTVVIAGLALGGAEKIVLDWINRIDSNWKIHLVLLRNNDREWKTPEGVVVTRFNGERVLEKLEILGKMLKASSNPVCLAHLLKNEEQESLRKGGAFVRQVFHNARKGWRDGVSSLDTTQPVITVSYDSKGDLRGDGWVGDVSVIHHFPLNRNFSPDSRNRFRKEWNVPKDAFVVGMIGAVKPQKDYHHALYILKRMHERGEKAYLVILGGPIGKDGMATWDSLVQTINSLGLRSFVAMPGFVNDASKCVPAFDVVLNTSHFEGLSIATLEVLTSGKPMVSSLVGGQGEVESENQSFLLKSDDLDNWVDAILRSRGSKRKTPSWAKFPSFRLWTLAHLARPYEPTDKVLFVTANLNSGGAQRSLVNLAKNLPDKSRFDIAVTGNSTVDFFYRELQESGARVFRTAEINDVFSHAEAIVDYVAQNQVGKICFWNVDPKLKLLLSKTLGFTKVQFIDVSPGGYSFEELEEIDEFAKLICFSMYEFYARLDQMILKYQGEVPAAYGGKVGWIRNGIPRASVIKESYDLGENPKVVVCGRIAPSKFLKEIVDAIALVKEKFPNVELHIYGAAESRCMEYADEVLVLAEEKLGDQVFFHGLEFDARESFPEYDTFVVLGKNQGCPNALLEALSVGMPVVANDDGGTREQVHDRETGVLIPSVDVKELSLAILSTLENRHFARHIGQSGMRHVMANFSMKNMVRSYASLLWNEKFEEVDVEAVA